MDGGNGLFHGSTEVDVESTVGSRRQSGLYAHFRRADVARLCNAANDFVAIQEIALFGTVRSGKRAELTRLRADIREVHVAIDDVRDRVARLPVPELVGRSRQGNEIASRRSKKRHDVLPCKHTTFERLLE